MSSNYKNASSDIWFECISHHLDKFPFNFTYYNKKYNGFGDLKLISEVETKIGERLTRIFTFEVDLLSVELKLTHSYAYGETEWTVRFTNVGSENSGIIEDPHSVLMFEGNHPVLKGIYGDHVNYYRPYAMDIAANPISFKSTSGRATHINFPYFNLEYGDVGVMLAIGWGGTWQADFRYDGRFTKYTSRAVNNLKTYLKAGESIRTALFVRADYTVRNENYATNYWRSWFINENLPKADASGKAIKPFSTCCLAADTGLPNSDGSISERYTTYKPSIDKMIEEDLKVDFRWVDAGWYSAPDGSSPEPFVKGHDWFDTVGSWVVDEAKWPGDTFREATDYARSKEMKTLVWFEPERTTNVDDLVKYHGYNKNWAIELDYRITNNIGDPDCYRWTADRIKNMLTKNKVDMYREDNNINPSILWKTLDNKQGEARCGITECLMLDAHYKLWDEILECTMSYGGCGFMDSCAAGGGRNDIESMRRAVPLLRSDFDRTSTGLRLSITSSFNKWIPFCGAYCQEKTHELDPTGKVDEYIWRASYLPVLNVNAQFVTNPNENFPMLRFGMREWDRVKPYLLKDFYVLTPWHTYTDLSGFTAYSFFDSEKKEGLLLAFRQEKCEENTLPITLPFIASDEKCIMTDEDTGDIIETEGIEMKEKGIWLYFDKPRCARLIWVKVQ